MMLDNFRCLGSDPVVPNFGPRGWLSSKTKDAALSNHYCIHPSSCFLSLVCGGHLICWRPVTHPSFLFHVCVHAVGMVRIEKAKSVLLVILSPPSTASKFEWKISVENFKQAGS